jgi:hypothetical protein
MSAAYLNSLTPFSLKGHGLMARPFFPAATTLAVNTPSDGAMSNFAPWKCFHK